MNRTNKIKAYMARVLAAAMVITMAAPPAQAYALSLSLIHISEPTRPY